MFKIIKLRKLKKIIIKSNLLDLEYYFLTYPDIKEKDIDPISHYLLYGAKEGRNPSKEFCTNFYLNFYTDVNITEINPLIHYILYGQYENRIVNEVQLKNPNTLSNINDLYNEITNLLEVNKIKETVIKNKEKEMKNYLKDWLNNEFEIPNFFSSKHYLENYDDIKETRVNPLLHYLKYGKKEGRIGYVNLSNNIKDGKKNVDNTKENIVFVSHESSSTGAPLLGYSISEVLSQKYNIIHIIIKVENIHEMFYSNADLILEDISGVEKIASYLFLKDLIKTRKIKAVIINSIVGHKVMYSANKLKIPVLFLIHEFAEYMRPIGTMASVTMNSQMVVVPATIIKNSITKEFKKMNRYNPWYLENIKILPQGKLPVLENNFGNDDSITELYSKLNINPDDDIKIIVGSGWVQIRKGVDLFVSIARYINKIYKGKCKFVWVGGGYQPEEDLAYSVYLEREIEYSGLEDSFIFLEHQKTLDNIFSISDVFCLTSRMDPFPNVVIDALSYDVHIACFMEASGSVEFLEKHNANCSIADFVDTYDLAEKVSLYLDNVDMNAGVNKEIAKKYLNFNNYVDNLNVMLDTISSPNFNNKVSYGKYIDFEKNSLNKKEIKLLKNIDINDILVDIKYFQINDKESLNNFLSDKEMDSLNDFYKYTSSNNISTEFLKSIQVSGKIELNHPLSKEKSFSSHSIQNSWATYLRFKSENEIFYVYQYDYAVEAIFLVEKGICIYFAKSYNYLRNTEKLITKLITNSEIYSTYFQEQNNFKGIKVQHPSPYHYYYLKITSLYRICESFKKTNFKFDVITDEKGGFIRVDKIFSNVVENLIYLETYTKVNKEKIPTECLNNEFYITIGDRWNSLKDREIPELDKLEIKDEILRIDNFILDKVDLIAKDSLLVKKVQDEKEKGSFILWLGITLGKRSWKEEIESYLCLINYLVTKYDIVYVVIDGWTFTHASESVERRHSGYTQDDIQKDKLVSMLPVGVESISIIGSTAEEKISIGKMSNFFVSNHATGSIWVSRIARSLGVAHISNGARLSSERQHIHWNGYIIPEELVSDIEEEVSTPFHISYNIDSEKFLNFCKNILVKFEDTSVQSKYISFEKGLLCKEGLNDLKQCSFEEISSSVKYYNLKDRNELKEILTEKEHRNLYSFSENNITTDFAIDFLESIKDSGQLNFYHPLNNEESTCSHSVQHTWANYLRFKSKTDVFYLYQFNYTIEAIFFPLRNICIALQTHRKYGEKKEAKARTKQLLKKVFNKVEYYNKYFLNKNTFRGVKLQHPSPYHYYYLKIPAFYNVFKYFEKSNFKFDIITEKKGAFLRVDKIFSEVVKNLVYLDNFTKVDKSNIPIECANNEFYLNLGKRWTFSKELDTEKLYEIDNAILDKLDLITKNNKLIKKFNQLNNKSDFVLWLGVTSGKRTWTEELESYLKLITYLESKYGKILVVIDGWTFAHPISDEIDRFHAGYSGDDVIKDKLISLLPNSVDTISVIGATAEEKLNIGKMVSFFVANHATGSIWISRVCKKLGVAHISNAARESSLAQHIHWNAHLLPKEIVRDVEEEVATPFHVSYNIESDKFLEFIISNDII